VNQLPPVILLNLLGQVDRIVPGNVLGHGPVEDHSHHEGEETDDDEGVDEGEPVDLRVEYMEVHVPSQSPWYGALDKGHRVCIVELVITRFGQVVLLDPKAIRCRFSSYDGVDRSRVDHHSDHPEMVRISSMIVNDDIVMIVQSRSFGIQLVVTKVEPLGIQENLPSLTILLHLTAWQPIDDEIQPVILFYPTVDEYGVLLRYPTPT